MKRGRPPCYYVVSPEGRAGCYLPKKSAVALARTLGPGTSVYRGRGRGGLGRVGVVGPRGRLSWRASELPLFEAAE